MPVTLIACLISFLAGFIDAIVGGGGLIQIPALLVLLPGSPPAVIFGTNKLAMMAGTVVALIRYLRRVAIPWASVSPAAFFAAFSAYLGAMTVSYIDPALLRPLILVLLVAVALHTYRKKDLGASSSKSRSPLESAIIGATIGVVIGFYDGFFGPGTGSFLIFAFVSLLGFEFLVASAAAKLVNVCTNLTPVLYFASHDQVLYHLALPMAACNILGSLIGTQLAFARGNAFIRRLFLCIIGVVILRYAWDIAQQWMK